MTDRAGEPEEDGFGQRPGRVLHHEESYNPATRTLPTVRPAPQASHSHPRMEAQELKEVAASPTNADANDDAVLDSRHQSSTQQTRRTINSAESMKHTAGWDQVFTDSISVEPVGDDPEPSHEHRGTTVDDLIAGIFAACKAFGDETARTRFARTDHSKWSPSREPASLIRQRGGHSAIVTNSHGAQAMLRVHKIAQALSDSKLRDPVKESLMVGPMAILQEIDTGLKGATLRNQHRPEADQMAEIPSLLSEGLEQLLDALKEPTVSVTLMEAVDEGKKIDRQLDEVDRAIHKSVESGGDVTEWEDLVNEQMLLLRRRLAIDALKRKQLEAAKRSDKFQLRGEAGGGKLIERISALTNFQEDQLSAIRRDSWSLQALSAESDSSWQGRINSTTRRVADLEAKCIELDSEVAALEALLAQTVSALVSKRAEKHIQSLKCEEMRLLQQADENTWKSFMANVSKTRDQLKQEEVDVSLHAKMLNLTREAVQQSVRIVSEAYETRLREIKANTLDCDREHVEVHQKAWPLLERRRIMQNVRLEKARAQADNLESDIKLQKLQFDLKAAAVKARELKEVYENIDEIEMIIRNLQKSCKQLDDKAMSSYANLRSAGEAREHPSSKTQSEILSEQKELENQELKVQLDKNPLLKRILIAEESGAKNPLSAALTPTQTSSLAAPGEVPALAIDITQIPDYLRVSAGPHTKAAIAAATPKKLPAQLKESKTCPSCTGPVKVGDTFCSLCGADISGSTKTVKSESKHQRVQEKDKVDVYAASNSPSIMALHNNRGRGQPLGPPGNPFPVATPLRPNTSTSTADDPRLTNQSKQTSSEWIMVAPEKLNPFGEDSNPTKNQCITLAGPKEYPWKKEKGAAAIKRMEIRRVELLAVMDRFEGDCPPEYVTEWMELLQCRAAALAKDTKREL